jgi:hypothetical protein
MPVDLVRGSVGTNSVPIGLHKQPYARDHTSHSPTFNGESDDNHKEEGESFIGESDDNHKEEGESQGDNRKT